MRTSWLFALVAACSVRASVHGGATCEPPPQARALVGGTLLDGRGGPAIPDAVVVMDNGKIACAGTRAKCPVPAGMAVLDVRGLWITPGLIDAHVHFSQSGWVDGRPDALDLRDRYPYEEVVGRLRRHVDRFFRSYLCSGVTGVFDVGGYPWSVALKARAERDRHAPHIAAAGPLLSTIDFWVNLPGEKQFLYTADADAGRQGVRYLASLGSDAAKLWFIPSKRPMEELTPIARAIADEALQRKLPLIVHAMGLRQAKEALRDRVHLFVHSVFDKPVDDEFLELARRQGVIYCPTLIVPGGYLRFDDAVRDQSAPALDDPNGCVDAETKALVAASALVPRVRLPARRLDPAPVEAARKKWATMSKVAAENLKRVAAAGIPVAMGTDAGNPLTLHGPAVYAEMEAMQAAGLTPMQVLVAATRGGAAAMLRPDLGTVERGKAADLLVVGADPAADIANLRKVRFVVRGGEVRSIAELRAPGPRS